MLLDKLMLVYRLDNTASADKETYTAHPSFPVGVYMNIQPATPEATLFSDGQAFKTYKAFTTASGIVEGYKLTQSGTTTSYLIRGRERYDYGMGQHYELILEKGLTDRS